MNADNIQSQKFYLSKSGIFVRQVVTIQCNDLYWLDYNFDDGEPYGSGICSVRTLANWAERELTQEEQERMQQSKALDNVEQRDRKLQRNVLDTISNFDLMQEVRERGLIEA